MKVVLARVLDRLPDLELAGDVEFGGVTAFNRGPVHLPVREVTSGRGVSAAVETTGNEGVQSAVLSSLSTGGCLALVGASGANNRVSLPVAAMIGGARTVRGVVIGDATAPFLLTLMELYRHGRFPVDKMIGSYPLDDIQTAIADALSGRDRQARPDLRVTGCPAAPGRRAPGRSRRIRTKSAISYS